MKHNLLNQNCSQSKGLALMLTLALIMFSLTSCNKDENPNPAGVPLEGTVWIFQSSAYTGCTDPLNNGTDTFVCTSTDCLTVQLVSGTLTFTETIGGVENSQTNSYTISGNTLTINDLGGTRVFTFTIVSNTLTLVGDGGDPGCTETTVLVKQ